MELILLIAILFIILSCSFYIYLQAHKSSKLYNVTNKIINIFLFTHQGRDTIAKGFMYLLQSLVELCKSLKLFKKANELDFLRDMIDNSRRIGRFFTYLTLIPSLWNYMNESSKGKSLMYRFKNFMKAISDIALIVYFLSDNYEMLHVMKLINMSPEQRYFVWDVCIINTIN